VSSAVAVRCDSLVHVFRTPGAEVAALRGADLVVDRGETVALLGPSGSGKTTLLWHFAGLLRPTAGTVEVAGQELNTLGPTALTALRRQTVGVVLQNPAANLLPYATGLGNLAFAASTGARSRREHQLRAHELLDAVGLAHAAHRVAGQLSGGEQQRLAVAAALMDSPPVLLADEPTSQLDAESARGVLDLILEVNERFGTTVVAVTHDATVGAALGRTVTIRDGRVGAEGRHGEDYLLVSKDGTITLPPELLDVMPPGTLARAVPHEEGIELRIVDRGGLANPPTSKGGG
jgi:ABC-type lipoprotein export system ATPase subunit